jgi:YegS/Rv2252/BmrU family lipid kinase
MTGLIINPEAGGYGKYRGVREVTDVLERCGVRAEIFHAEPDGTAAAARLAVEHGADTLIAAGGDGTVSAVASAITGTGTSLGILPIGTLNHFAKDMQIPLDVEQAARVIAGGKTSIVDVGEVNGRIFLNNSSLGLYPRIVMLRRKHRKLGRNRWVALFVAMATALRRMPFVHLRLLTEGTELSPRETALIFIGNNEYETSGGKAGTRQSLDGGHLFVYIVNATSRAQLVGLGIRALMGRLRDQEDFAVLRVTEAWVETRRRRVTVSFDGEAAVMNAPLHYRIRPGALRVLVAR